MMEMIGQAIASLFGEALSVWFLGDFLKFIHRDAVQVTYAF
jgi:hypothetical protein